MRRQDSDRQGRFDSNRSFTGGDRRHGFSRDYDRHSQSRFRDQDRDSDFGSDMNRRFDRGSDFDRSSSFGSEGRDRDDYRRSNIENSRYGTESDFSPGSNIGSGMGSMGSLDRSSSWGVQGDRDLYGDYGSYGMGMGMGRQSRTDDLSIGQSHWGRGQYQDWSDRDNSSRDFSNRDYSSRDYSSRDNRRLGMRDRDNDRHESNFFERIGEKVGEFFGKGPKGYKRSDDRIREDVSEALWAHPRIDASEVEVDVKDGVVTLSGTVTERRMKRLIEDEIDNLPGVRDVINNVRTQDRQSVGSSMSGSESLSTSGSTVGSTGSMNTQNNQNSSINGKSGRKTQ